VFTDVLYFLPVRYTAANYRDYFLERRREGGDFSSIT
jgi:hypothetical protein